MSLNAVEMVINLLKRYGYVKFPEIAHLRDIPQIGNLEAITKEVPYRHRSDTERWCLDAFLVYPNGRHYLLPYNVKTTVTIGEYLECNPGASWLVVVQYRGSIRNSLQTEVVFAGAAQLLR